MRANPEAYLDSRERYKDTSDFYKAKGSDFPPCPKPAITTKDQLGCWAQRAGENLPGGSELLNSHFKICRSPSPGVCNAAAGSAIEISMAWRVKSGTCIDANDQTADKSICTFNLRAQLWAGKWIKNCHIEIGDQTRGLNHHAMVWPTLTNDLTIQPCPQETPSLSFYKNTTM